MARTYRDLFPELRTNPTLTTPDRQRRYVLRTIEALCKARDLTVEELCNQPRAARFVIGLIMNNDDFADNGFRAAAQAMPTAIARYTVRLKSIHGTPLRFKIGHEVIEERVVGATVPESIPITQASYDYPLGEGVTEGDVPLPRAYQIMMREGKHCAPARGEAVQRYKWQYEEVPPAPESIPAPLLDEDRGERRRSHAR